MEDYKTFCKKEIDGDVYCWFPHEDLKDWIFEEAFNARQMKKKLFSLLPEGIGIPINQITTLFKEMFEEGLTTTVNGVRSINPELQEAFETAFKDATTFDLFQIYKDLTAFLRENSQELTLEVLKQKTDSLIDLNLVIVDVDEAACFEELLINLVIEEFNLEF